MTDKGIQQFELLLEARNLAMNSHRQLLRDSRAQLEQYEEQVVARSNERNRLIDAYDHYRTGDNLCPVQLQSMGSHLVYLQDQLSEAKNQRRAQQAKTDEIKQTMGQFLAVNKVVESQIETKKEQYQRALVKKGEQQMNELIGFRRR